MNLSKILLKLLVVILINTPFSSHALENDCVLLVYHRFSDDGPKSTSTSPEIFKQHLEYLKNNNYSVLPLKNVISSLQSKESLPPNCISLTADDGFLSIYTEAFPLLVEYQFPMSVFVSTNPIDKKYASMMTWSQLREMAPLVDIYNHSVNHLHLVNQSAQIIEDEILSAQERIATEMSTNDKFFAYPYGEFDDSSYSYLKSEGYIAFGQQSGVASQTSDFLNIPRFSMSGPYAQMNSFSLKVKTLAMPIESSDPRSMIFSGDLMPVLNLNFSRELTSYEKSNFSCYVSGQDKANLKWDGLQSVSIWPNEPLAIGRSRYNCTMPYKEAGRYYWFSKLWLRL